MEPRATRRPSSAPSGTWLTITHDMTGTVAADRDVGQRDELVGVLEVLHEGDRADVEITLDELGAELLRGVLGELQVQQGAGPGQAPVQGDAVQELDVADPGTYPVACAVPR